MESKGHTISKTARGLVIAVVAALSAGVLANAALAAPTPTATASRTVTNYALPAGACYLPTDVAFAGIAPFVEVAGVRYTNPFSVPVTVREFTTIHDFNTGAMMGWHWVGDRVVQPGQSTTFAADQADLSFRSVSNAFWATAKARTEVYYNSSVPFQVWVGTPSTYRQWTNSGFQTFVDKGTYASYCQ